MGALRVLRVEAPRGANSFGHCPTPEVADNFAASGGVSCVFMTLT